MGAFHFAFERGVSLADAEMSLHLAMFAVEGLVGQVRVRLGVRYVLDTEAHAIVIDGGNRVGQMVSRVYAGLLLREFGEDAFCMRESDTFPVHLEQERAVPA
jgi:hypothetical protein